MSLFAWQTPLDLLRHQSIELASTRSKAEVLSRLQSLLDGEAVDGVDLPELRGSAGSQAVNLRVRAVNRQDPSRPMFVGEVVSDLAGVAQTSALRGIVRASIFVQVFTVMAAAIPLLIVVHTLGLHAQPYSFAALADAPWYAFLMGASFGWGMIAFSASNADKLRQALQLAVN